MNMVNINGKGYTEEYLAALIVRDNPLAAEYGGDTECGHVI